ncbi:MAG TPA: hypothetical protein VGI83_04410 [Gemmatimonadales bacterium]
MVNRLQKLSDSGRSAAVVAELGALPVQELEQSPTLALLFGIAQGRLGRFSSGKQWVAAALDAARARGDSSVEARALNVAGAIAFEEGRIDEAMGHFTQGGAEAERRGDRTTVGRCTNNMGVIANLRGEYGRAIGSYTVALAAFQQAGYRTGIAEALHNMAITYRDQRTLAKALEAEEQAAAEAQAVGATALLGLIFSGRAAIRLWAGEGEVARFEVQRALDLHREVDDAVGEAEDLRVLAGALDLLRETPRAEALLRDVIVRAKRLNRPLLIADAERDLSRLLKRTERAAEAREVAVSAKKGFESLGAVVEVRRLDALLAEMAG